MIELLIAVLGTIALLLAATPLYRREKDARQKRSIITGNVIALAIVWGQFAQQYFDSAADDKKHAELVEQNQKLISQNEVDEKRQTELADQNKKLIEQNSELGERLRPVIEAAQAKHPGGEPHTTCFKGFAPRTCKHPAEAMRGSRHSTVSRKYAPRAFTTSVTNRRHST